MHTLWCATYTSWLAAVCSAQWCRAGQGAPRSSQPSGVQLSKALLCAARAMILKPVVLRRMAHVQACMLGQAATADAGARGAQGLKVATPCWSGTSAGGARGSVAGGEALHGCMQVLKSSIAGCACGYCPLANVWK